MTIRKEPSGRWRAVLKSGRSYVAGKTFDTRREAASWLARERAALAGGVDPRVGRVTVEKLLPQWLDERRASMAAKTLIADTAVPRLTPMSLLRMAINRVSDREIMRALVALKRAGLAESSIKRYRASLSTFFAWAVRERLVVANPVTSTRVPRDNKPRVEMQPFSEPELDDFIARAAVRSAHLADVLLVDAWTGLRWSELRAIRVRDFVELPMPMLVVQVAKPEGVNLKAPKSGRTRRVPVADRVLPVIRDMARDKAAGDLLFTSGSGHQLHASALKRSVAWQSIAVGRRIHDLRHTAACLWLAKGVDPVTVQAWGARLDRDDEPVPAPPGHCRGSGRIGPSECVGGRRGHTTGHQRRTKGAGWR